MEGSQENSNAPPPFLTKTYEMVDDPMTNAMVSWSESGRSFIVWNPPEFSRDLLPQYFKHNNFSSFVRQLNTYGFRKIDPYQWEFANEEFIKGHKHMLKNILRRKPVHSHSLPNQGNSYISLSDSEKRKFEEEIKRLSHEKIHLQLELQRNQDENQGFRNQIRLLSERFQDMDHRQGQLVAFLAQLLQKPGSAAILEQQSENHSKRRRLLDSDQFHSKTDRKEYLSLPSQDGSQVSIPSPPLNKEQVEKLESSIEHLETVLHGIDKTLNEVHGFGVSSRTSGILVTEMHDFSGDHDTDEDRCSLISHLSSRAMDMCSSPDLAGSVCRGENPPSPCLSLGFDVGPKSSEIDVNSQPASDPESEALKEKLGEKADSPPPVKENDHFWAQFLTENPNLSNAQVYSESVSGNGRMIDDKPLDHKRAWWTRENVDDLTKHMRHLYPAERA